MSATMEAPGQILDLASAQEFMREAAEQISEEEMSAIQDELREKSVRFRAVLGGSHDEVASATPALVRGVLRSIFPVRRRTDQILEANGAEQLALHFAELLHGEAPLESRFSGFCSQVKGVDTLSTDLATELLHFTYPEQFWLWTHWMWDPKAQTGALRLVTQDEYELGDSADFATYLKVGRAVAFVQETATSAGLHRLGHGPFGIDVFLVCIYGIYTYTVLRMRMTREFNQAIPPLPQLARRLLGIHALEV